MYDATDATTALVTVEYPSRDQIVDTKTSTGKCTRNKLYEVNPSRAIRRFCGQRSVSASLPAENNTTAIASAVANCQRQANASAAAVSATYSPNHSADPVDFSPSYTMTPMKNCPKK